MKIATIRAAFSRAHRYLSDQQLIIVDKRVVALVVACGLAFVLLVGFKLHGSSVPMWNQVFGTDPQQGLVAGSAKVIRSDEWYATTPIVLSQAARGYPLSNAAAGSGSSPLLINVPVAHPTTLARPQFWGYFLLGPERGFSWYWWTKWFGLFVGSFTVLMLLTRNRFWLSLFGSAWLMASTFTQWWFSTTLPELLAAACWLFVAGTYVVLSRRRVLVVAAGLVAAAAAVTFALVLYPPYQIPLAYLVLALAIGLGIDRVRRANVLYRWPWRAAAVVIAVALAGGLLLVFWQDARDTIAVVSQTVYPGSRRIGGGGVTLPFLLLGTYSVFLNQNHFPPAWAWANVVELSGFLLLWPLAALGVVRSWVTRVRPYAVELALLVFCLLTTVWMTLGFPDWLERITLLDRATNLRAMAALGPASILVCVVFLARGTTRVELARTVGRLPAVAAALVVFTAAWLVGLELDTVTVGFFGTGTVLYVSLLLTVVAYLFLRRHRAALAVVVLLFILPASLHINPLSQGLTPLTSKRLYGTVRTIVQADPDARWVIYDNDTVANFIKSAGALAINGVQFAPDRALMSALDPTGEFEQVWNRYARINFIPDTNGRATFALTGDASYNVTVNPCAQVMVDAGVTYVAFVGQLPKHIECLEEVTSAPANDVRIFRRR